MLLVELKQNKRRLLLLQTLRLVFANPMSDYHPPVYFSFEPDSASHTSVALFPHRHRPILTPILHHRCQIVCWYQGLDPQQVSPNFFGSNFVSWVVRLMPTSKSANFVVVVFGQNPYPPFHTSFSCLGWGNCFYSFQNCAFVNCKSFNFLSLINTWN